MGGRCIPVVAKVACRDIYIDNIGHAGRAMLTLRLWTLIETAALVKRAGDCTVICIGNSRLVCNNRSSVCVCVFSSHSF